MLKKGGVRGAEKGGWGREGGREEGGWFEREEERRWTYLPRL